MKEIIAALLIVLIFAVWGLEETIKEGNLTEVDKTQIAKQKEVDKITSNYNDKKKNERVKLLLNSRWDEVENESKLEWALTNTIDSLWARLLFLLIIISTLGLFGLKMMKPR